MVRAFPPRSVNSQALTFEQARAKRQFREVPDNFLVKPSRVSEIYHLYPSEIFGEPIEYLFHTQVPGGSVFKAGSYYYWCSEPYRNIGTEFHYDRCISFTDCEVHSIDWPEDFGSILEILMRLYQIRFPKQGETTMDTHKDIEWVPLGMYFEQLWGKGLNVTMLSF